MRGRETELQWQRRGVQRLKASRSPDAEPDRRCSGGDAHHDTRTHTRTLAHSHTLWHTLETLSPVLPLLLAPVTLLSRNCVLMWSKVLVLGDSLTQVRASRPFAGE